MKLSSLSLGDKFILVRTGEKYTLGGKYFYKGKATSRFTVYSDSEHWSDSYPEIGRSLNHQCEVIKID